MMRLALLFVFATLAQAQTITNLAVDEIGPNCVRFVFDVAGVSGSTTFAIDAGTTSSLGVTLNDETWSSNGTYYRYMCHAQASETWYYRLSIGATTTDCTATCTDCVTGDQAQFAADSNGINCTDTEPFRVTHSAAGTRTPNAPSGPADKNPYDDCDSDLTPTISSCANLATDLSTLAGTVGTHKIEVPAGICTVSSDFVFPTLTSASRICLGPQYTDADLEPTDFTQVSMDHRPNMLVIRHTNPYDRQDTAGTHQVVTIPDNYTITDTVFEEIPTVQNPIQATVTNYSGATTVTLTLSATCPDEFDVGALLVLNMPGLSDYDPVVSINSCTSTSLVVTSATSFSGTLSGNGTATLGSVPISNAANNGSGAIRITTAVAHGLPTGTFTGSDTVYIHNVDGTTEANGRFLFTVIDSTNIDLTSSTFSNTYSASDFDFLRLNSGVSFGTVDAGSTTGVRFGRVIMGNPDPHYTQNTDTLSAYNATNLVLRDSIIFGGGVKCPVSLTDSLPDCENYGTRNGGYIRADGADGLYVRNNLMIGSGGIGIELNNQQDVPEDFTFQANQVIATDRPFPDVQGNGLWPNSLGYYQDNRHIIELKSGCVRCLITENLIDGAGCGQEGRSCYAIGLFNTNSGTSPSGTYRQQDVEVSWNYFRNVGSAVGLSTQFPGGTGDISFNNRISIHDNFIEGAAYELRQSPRDVGSALATDTPQGTQATFRNGGQYINYENNTHYRQTGEFGGCIFTYQGDKIPECVVEGNIFTYHKSSTRDEGFCRFSPNLSDFDESTNLTEFDKLCPGGSFAGNLILAGVEDPENVSALKASTADADTVTSAEMSSAWPTSGSFASVSLGPTDSSYSARHTSLFGDDQTPESGYTSYGVSDLAALKAAVFGVTDLQATYGSSTLTFSWTSPTTTGCTVRLSGDGWTSAQAQTDASSSTSQSVSFTSISTGTYEALVECENSKPIFWKREL